MPKSVETCVAKLMQNPKFNPKIGSGKADKDKEEIAYAICNSKHNECMVCEITDDVLFLEAIEKIQNELTQQSTKEHDFVLEGIAFTQFAEAVSKEDIDKINKFSVKSVESKDITIYTALLIDDKITRNNTQYPKEFQSMLLSLPVGEGNFVGAPILFGDTKDHQHTASSQVGRIFEAWQVIDAEKHYGVMAKIYVLNEGNEDLINKINSGVLKEMSIATKVGIPMCSICGQDIRQCSHEQGVNGAYVVMSGNGFVAEASFVAVPGSNSAKILNEDETKKFLKLEQLKELVSPLINESLGAISKLSTDMNDSITLKMKEMTEKLDTITAQITSHSETLVKHEDKITKEAEVISYKIDILSTLEDLKEDIENSKGFLIRNLSKMNINAQEFRTDIVPELTQGLKGEDILMIFKLFYDNVEIAGINLSNLENALKVTPPNTNLTYTGTITDISNLARFLIKKNDNIKVRIMKLQGKFDLQELERKNLITEATKYGILCGKFNFTEKNLSEKFFETFSTEEIVKLKNEFFESGTKLFTPEIVELKGNKEEQPKDESKPKASLREIAQQIVKGGNTNV